jgi:hypothetical protein
MAKAKDKPNKTDAVRAAISEGVEGNQAIADWVKAKYGLEMTSKHVSVVRSTDAKKMREGTGAPKKRGRPRLAAAKGKSTAVEPVSNGATSFAKQYKALKEAIRVCGSVEDAIAGIRLLAE